VLVICDPERRQVPSFLRRTIYALIELDSGNNTVLIFGGRDVCRGLQGAGRLDPGNCSVLCSVFRNI